jgi:hypothetical protein
LLPRACQRSSWWHSLGHTPSVARCGGYSSAAPALLLVVMAALAVCMWCHAACRLLLSCLWRVACVQSYRGLGAAGRWHEVGCTWQQQQQQQQQSGAATPARHLSPVAALPAAAPRLQPQPSLTLLHRPCHPQRQPFRSSPHPPPLHHNHTHTAPHTHRALAMRRHLTTPTTPLCWPSPGWTPSRRWPP